MAPRRKGAKIKSTAPPERAQPETAEREEEEEEFDDDSSTGKPCKDREKFAFKPAEENILVEWFKERKEFYDKSDSKFYSKASKRQKLEALAKRLSCDVDKIEGWFRNQRTAVGKLKKNTQSGSVVQKRTPRQEWQLKSFTFLQEYITPRTYTTESTEAASSYNVHNESKSANEERPQLPASSSVAPGGSRPGKRAKTSRLEDVMLKYFKKPQPSQAINKKTLFRPMDAREAFGQYMIQYMHRIPDSRWDQFTMDALQLLSRYSRPEGDQQQPQPLPAVSLQLQTPPQQHYQPTVMAVPPLMSHSTLPEGFSQLTTSRNEDIANEPSLSGLCVMLGFKEEDVPPPSPTAQQEQDSITQS